jgi:signal transduction histidine kinase
MRRVVERPEVGTSLQIVNLQNTVNHALYLLEPECKRLGVQPAVSGNSLLLTADPVALEQIIHNLLTNALQALAQVPPSERALTFAAVTLRLYLPTAMVSESAFEPAYIAVAWLCWVPNLIAAELIFNRPVRQSTA